MTASEPAPDSASQQLALWASSLDYSKLPDVVVEKAKVLLSDYVGVCYRGMQTDSAKSCVDATAQLAGSGNATVVGHDRCRPPAWAALANGLAAHSIELDDVSAESSLHPAVVVFPASLAVAEELDSDGEAFLTSVIAGYEVMLRVGNALNAPAAYARGFHPTGVAGVFGATAAAGRLLGLSPEELSNAFGIAGTLASGSMEYLATGAWTKRLNAGWAAHGGIVAAFMAKSGFTGPPTVLEGRFGFLQGYSSDPFPEKATRGLGDGFEITGVKQKAYACCAYIHPSIDAVREIRRAHQFPLESIRRIEATALSGGKLLVCEPIEKKRRPTDIVGAQFSLPFGVAMALLHDSAGLGEFTKANLADPRALELMQKVHCVYDPRFDADYPKQWRGRVRITLDSGQVLESTIDAPSGDPKHPMTSDEQKKKLLSLIGDDALAERITASIAALPRTSPSDLMALLRA